MSGRIRQATALAFGFLLAMPALADKPGKNKKKGEARPPEVEITFDVRQREAIRGYVVETYGRDRCPPGLAKKGNGCLPPGQAKKLYSIGRPLPPQVVVVDVPVVLAERLGPPPVGYRYVVVDGDVLKIALATGLVVDLVEAFVH
jgi:hypothetical protein